MSEAQPSAPAAPAESQGTSVAETVAAVAQQAAPAEPQKPETPKPEQQDDKFAAKFAALSRKERMLKQQEAQLQAKLKELEGTKPKIDELTNAQKQLLEKLQNNPLELLKEHGITFERLAEMALNDGKPTLEMLLSRKEQELRAEIEGLKKLIEGDKKAQEQQKQEQAVAEFKASIQAEVETNNNYELIRANEATDLVYQVIKEHFARTAAESEDGQGVIMTIQEACDAVENYLLEEAKKHLKLGKIQSLLAPQAPAAAPAKEAAKTVSKTLSNTDASAVPQSDAQKLSREESIKRAAALIRFDA